jgi:hypothetical protein
LNITFNYGLIFMAVGGACAASLGGVAWSGKRLVVRANHGILFVGCTYSHGAGHCGISNGLAFDFDGSLGFRRCELFRDWRFGVRRRRSRMILFAGALVRRLTQGGNGQ